MIDFGLTSIDFTHIGVPVDHAGDAMASAKLGQVPGPEGGTTNLHISTPNNGNVFEDTIYDKNLWTAAPHPSDNDKVCGWVHDMAASEPKSVCDQWSKDDWNDWANHYEDQGCNVPKCGENYPAQLIPFDQSAPADASAAAAQLNPSAGTHLNQIGIVSLDQDVAMLRGKPAHFLQINLSKSVASEPPQTDCEEDMPSQQKSERSWSAMVKSSKATPGHFMLSFHALFLAALQTLLNGGDEQSFKDNALSNAAAVTPVGQALMSSHLFGPRAEPVASD